MEFGFRIRELRKAKGISLREFAKAIGISAPYLSNIERGMVPPPSADVVKLIAEELEIDSDELLQNANRFDIDQLDEIRRGSKKIEATEKVIKFLTSAAGMKDDDTLGGFQGIMETIIGEMILNPEYQKQSSFRNIKFLLDLIAEAENEEGKQKIEIRRRLGRIFWNLFESIRHPYPVAEPLEKDNMEEEFARIMKDYSPEFLKEVVKRENLSEIVQLLSQEKPQDDAE